MGIKVCIMAGGGGTRLFPLSQTAEGRLPKQFLSLLPGPTMLQRAVDRVPEAYGVTVIPELKYAQAAEEQARGIREDVDILTEPFGCNTAAAVLYTAAYESYELGSPETVLAFIPADHELDKTVFRQLLARGAETAEARSCVVTIGIEPDRAETNYGYIRRDGQAADDGTCRVGSFVEKPDLKRAQEYLAEGTYYWNAGMFIARASVFLEAASAHCPEILEVLLSIWEEGADQLTAYRQLKERGLTLSIDYALMEHIASTMRLVPAPVDLRWNDLGNFESLSAYMHRDEHGNESFSEAAGDSSFSGSTQGNLVCNYTDVPVYVRDCGELTIVVTPDGILVRPREKS